MSYTKNKPKKEKKIDFKDLDNKLKAVVIFGAISLAWNIIVFISALIIGFAGGI